MDFATTENWGLDIAVNGVAPAFVQTGLSEGFHSNPEVYDHVAQEHPTLTWVDEEDVAKVVATTLDLPRSVRGVDLKVDNGVAMASIPGSSAARTIRSFTGEPCCGGPS